jgi:hypothetical protein
MEDYRDIDFGFLDDVIDRASFQYYVFVIGNKTIAPDGSERVTYVRYTINGSLQTYKRSRTYDTDGNKSNISGRTGKFYAKYNVILNENDLIQKTDDGTTYRVTQVHDYSYAGVRNYEVERLGLDEIKRYNFAQFVEDKFPEGTVTD